MSALVTTLALLGFASLVFFFTKWFGIAFNAFIRLFHERHKKIRLEQRPSRIFLIRHGESQANVDTSKYRL
jgi:hypothetical protein